MNDLNTIYQILVKPFSKFAGVISAFFILFTTTGVMLYTMVYRTLPYALYLTLHGFLLAYIITFILSLMPKKLRVIISLILLAFSLIFFIIEFYCVYQLHTPFDADFATLLMATNINEANEFMQSMVPLSFILLVSLICLIIIIVCYILNQIKCKDKWYIIPLIIVFLSTIAFIRNPSVWKNSIEGKVYSILTYDVPNDLREYFVHPKIISSNKSPQNIVVIMGESFSKHHSSLYGYTKCTSPLLSLLKKDSTLIIFNNATSAGLSTMQSFTYMMSDYSPEQKSDKQWYEHLLLHDVLHQAGYNTHWFSNHSNTGVHNNVTRLLAYASDDTYYCGNQLSGDFRTSYDEEILELATPYIEKFDSLSHNFYFFHLMGSHFKFDMRYPKEFSKFSEKDYTDKLIHQRSTLAAYDNSILYNDYVVYNIIQLFKDKESIIIYLSDHGLDIYNSSDNYAAHGIPNNPISSKYGSEIPFLIYISESYKKKYPNTVKQLNEIKNNAFRTDSLMNFIMYIGNFKVDDIILNQ